jgi:hypothetical protein
MTRYGVRYVDGRADVLARKAGSAVDLFPPGGTHWTYHGSSGAARKIVALYNGVVAPDRRRPLFLVPRPSATPSGTDTDLADLANLLWPRTAGRYMDVATPAGTPEPGAPEAAVVGGSFCAQLTNLLAAGGAFSRVTLFFYASDSGYNVTASDFRLRKTRYPQDYAAILTAPLVVLEENEILAASRHGHRLVEFLAMQDPGFPDLGRRPTGAGS